MKIAEGWFTEDLARMALMVARVERELNRMHAQYLKEFRRRVQAESENRRLEGEAAVLRERLAELESNTDKGKQDDRNDP